MLHLGSIDTIYRDTDAATSNSNKTLKYPSLDLKNIEKTAILALFYRVPLVEKINLFQKCSIWVQSILSIEIQMRPPLIPTKLSNTLHYISKTLKKPLFWPFFTVFHLWRRLTSSKNAPFGFNRYYLSRYRCGHL